MQPHDTFAVADRRGNQPHPAAPSADSRLNLGIQREPAFMPDDKGTQAFHGGARLFTIERHCILSTDRCASRQSEDVINSPGPDQRIVGKVAFPASGMMNSKMSYFGRFNNVGYGAIQDAAQLKVAWLFVEWPAVMKL
jgi:hypothetical protein